MVGRKMACFGAAAFLGSLILGTLASPVQAQHRTVTVTAHQDQLTRVVPFADLSLATRDGRHVLIHRVSVAVYEVCPKHDYWGMELDAATCREYAWAGAQPQIKRAFDKAASGAPMAMSLEVTGVIGK